MKLCVLMCAFTFQMVCTAHPEVGISSNSYIPQCWEALNTEIDLILNEDLYRLQHVPIFKVLVLIKFISAYCWINRNFLWKCTLCCIGESWSIANDLQHQNKNNQPPSPLKIQNPKIQTFIKSYISHIMIWKQNDRYVA